MPLPKWSQDEVIKRTKEIIPLLSKTKKQSILPTNFETAYRSYFTNGKGQTGKGKWSVSWGYSANGIPIYGEGGSVHIDEDVGLTSLSHKRYTLSVVGRPSDAKMNALSEKEFEDILAKYTYKGIVLKDIVEQLMPMDPNAAAIETTIDPPKLFYINPVVYLSLSGREEEYSDKGFLMWCVCYTKKDIRNEYDLKGLVFWFSPDGKELVGISSFFLEKKDFEEQVEKIVLSLSK
jgi:hypothetical protein